MSCRRIGESRRRNISGWVENRELSRKLSDAPESIRAFRECGPSPGMEIGRTRDREKEVQEADKWAELWRRDRSRSHKDSLGPIKLFPE